SSEHLRQTLAEIRPVRQLGQLILPGESQHFLDFLREQAVPARDPAEENRGIDRVCDESEDDRRAEERVLLPVWARNEIPGHAEDRDGGREKEVGTPEPQAPAHRGEEKKPYVRGETAPEVRNEVSDEVIHQDCKPPPRARRCGAL